MKKSANCTSTLNTFPQVYLPLITSAFLLDILGDADEGAGSSVSNTSTNLKTTQMDSGRGKAVTHQP